MKSIFPITLCLCFFIAVSCNKKTESIRSDSNIKTIKSLNKESDLSKDSPPFEEVVIVPLETNDDILIGDIENVQINDSLIFISDGNKKLFVFNKDGKFRNKIGAKGNGPGEYLAIGTFFIDEINNQIVITDQASFAFYYYGIDGQFKSKKKIDQSIVDIPRSALLLDENNLLQNYIISPGSNTAYNLYDITEDKIIQKKEYNHISVIDHHLAFSNHPMTESETGADMIMPLCDTIFNCHDGKIEPKYIIEHEKKMAPIEKYKLDFDKTITWLDMQYTEDGFFTGFKDIFETKEHILLNYGITGYNSGYFLADKTSLEGNYHSFSFFEDIDVHIPQQIEAEIFTMPFFRIKTTDGENFVSLVQAYQLLPFKEKINVHKDPNLAKLKTVIDSLDEEDNPVLIFYKLKED
jgi:hypothetical protein